MLRIVLNFSSPSCVQTQRRPVLHNSMLVRSCALASKATRSHSLGACTGWWWSFSAKTAPATTYSGRLIVYRPEDVQPRPPTLKFSNQLDSIRTPPHTRSPTHIFVRRRYTTRQGTLAGHQDQVNTSPHADVSYT